MRRCSSEASSEGGRSGSDRRPLALSLLEVLVVPLRADALPLQHCLPGEKQKGAVGRRSRRPSSRSLSRRFLSYWAAGYSPDSSCPMRSSSPAASHERLRCPLESGTRTPASTSCSMAKCSIQTLTPSSPSLRKRVSPATHCARAPANTTLIGGTNAGAMPRRLSTTLRFRYQRRQCSVETNIQFAQSLRNMHFVPAGSPMARWSIARLIGLPDMRLVSTRHGEKRVDGK